jgi:hypothetical protein
MFYVDGHAQTMRFVPTNSQILAPANDYSYVGNFSLLNQSTGASSTQAGMQQAIADMQRKQKEARENKQEDKQENKILSQEEQKKQKAILQPIANSNKPLNLQGSVLKPAPNGFNDCVNFCNNDTNCSHFQFQTLKDGSKQCINMYQGDSTSILPSSSTVMPVQPNDDVVSSELYVRNKKINLSTDYMSVPIQQKYIEKSSGMDIFSKYTMSFNPMIVPEKVGVESKADYRAAIGEQQKMLFGENTPVTEGFKYDMNDCQGDGCVNKIYQTKIKPLSDLMGAYAQNQGELITGTTNLYSNIDVYNELHDKLNKDATYDYNPNKSVMGNLQSGNVIVPYYIQPKPNMADGMMHDVHQLIIQENTTYILGTIAAASLLITGIVFGSK